MSAHEQEFVVRLPERDHRRKFHVMKFNSSLNVDTSNWTQVRMVRENNRKDFVREDDMPKFGAGSEFGRDVREEARRKKYGIKSKRYNPDDQPWLLRVGSKKEGKQYRGVREGGISDNTTYYVFTHAKDGSFEAHPVTEWYNFTPRVTYNTLNAEEAEERFAERGKILNHFAIMVGKKLKQSQDDNEDFDDDEVKGKKTNKRKSKDFKVSDMDDWVESGDELDSDSDSESGKKKKSDGDDDDDGSKKKKNSRSKDSKKRPKKKKEDPDDEAFEDSDDGDHEGSEVDYMSDESSDSEEELQAKGDIKGIDQDEALAKMLDSESSEDEFEDKKDDQEDEDNQDDDKDGKKVKKNKDEGKGSSKSSVNNSRSTTPTPEGASGPSDEKAARLEKRKRLVENVLDPNSEPAGKKARTELFSSSTSSSVAPPPPPPPSNRVEAALEEDVRRYLARKPMTTTELLKKLSSKKTKVQKDDLMPVLYNILTRIDPHKHKVKGVMYLSLKGDK